ncbi:MAG TPA: hypothetical protein VKP30_15620, partial [Polyangiaceae bacterium]|nr:hypothetical protein [Polyangiaceae bacterium]
MNEPRRLCDTGDAFEQALLGSARRDYGSSGAQARCIAAVTAAAGVVAHASGAAAVTAHLADAGATSLGASTSGAGALGASTSAATAAAGSSGVIASIAAKGVAVGLALGLSVQGAVVVSRHLSQTEASPSVASVQRPATPRARARVDNASPNSVSASIGDRDEHHNAAPSLTASPRVNATPPVVPSVVQERASIDKLAAAIPEIAGPVPPAPANSALGNALEREVALIDEARLVCRARDYEFALVLIERYQREFAHGALLPESLVIRVQALVGLGRKAEAERLAVAFMANNESSPITR